MPERLTHKLGPLPIYAWALIAVGGFLLYRRYKGHGAGAGSSPTATNPVPFGDSSGIGSGGIGDAQVPNVIQGVPGQNVTDSAQAAGGGTSSGSGTSSSPSAPAQAVATAAGAIGAPPPGSGSPTAAAAVFQAYHALSNPVKAPIRSRVTDR